MDDDNDQASAAKEVMDYVLTEYTRDGVHCRSSNPQGGVFEAVLPQVFPNFGMLMQDLCDSGVYDVEYHADANESRLLVFVGSGRLAAGLKQRSGAAYRWIAYAVFSLAVLLAAWVLTSEPTKAEL